MEKVYSQSLGIKDLNKLYGSWIEENGVFKEQRQDFWHIGSTYYVVTLSGIEALKERVAQTLLYSSSDCYIVDIKNISTSVIYVPVAPVENGGYCLYKDEKGQYEEISKIFGKNNMAEGLDFNTFEWTPLSTDLINEFGRKNKILPLNIPYIDFNMHAQHFGRTDDQNMEVFFVPIVKVTVELPSQKYVWYSLGDSQSSLLQCSGTIPPDKLLTEGYPYCPITGKKILGLGFLVLAVFLGYAFWTRQDGFGFFVAIVISTFVLLIVYLVLLALLGRFLNIIAEYTLGALWNAYYKLKIKRKFKYRIKALRIKGFSMQDCLPPVLPRLLAQAYQRI